MKFEMEDEQVKGCMIHSAKKCESWAFYGKMAEIIDKIYEMYSKC